MRSNGSGPKGPDIDDGIQIYVCGIDGRNIGITISPTTKVYEIKEIVHQRTKVPLHYQVTTYNGKPLQDQWVLMEISGITHGSTVRTTSRLNGGMTADEKAIMEKLNAELSAKMEDMNNKLIKLFEDNNKLKMEFDEKTS